MKLQRIHYNSDNHVVSDEVLTITKSSRVGQLFTQHSQSEHGAKLKRAAFLREDGEEIVWLRT